MRVQRKSPFSNVGTILAVLLEVLLCIAGSASAQDGWPIVNRQPYIQMVTHDSAVVVWRTERPIFPIVVFGDALDDLNDVVAPNQIVLRVSSFVDAPPDIPRLRGADFGVHQYEAHIRGLRPDSIYYYSISDFLTPLIGGDERHQFRTAPDPGNDDRPLRFWVVGDSGDGSVGQFESYRGFQTYLEREPESTHKPVDGYIHVGDMAYTGGGDAEFSANFFGVYTDLLRRTCCWPSMGNHEGANSSGATGIGPYYDAYVVPTRGEAGGVPSGTEAYYAFNYGNVHFICLNSHDIDRTPTGAMAQWLIADLEEVNAEWLVAFWHHPPYTKGTHDSDREIQLIEMRSYIMPILESAGVDLILTGHSHTYERSMLVDGAYGTPTIVDGVVLDDGDGDPAGDGAYRKSPAITPNQGSVSVVSGHGRAAFQVFGKSPVMRKTIPFIGSFLLDIDDRVLTGRMLDGFGSVRDEFQIVKDTPVEPTRLSHPWRPSGPGIVVSERSPGARTLEMFPVPPAPDASVRYEINGDEVTELSPVYDGPISLAATDRLVQAKTYWRNDKRISPATTVVIPTVAASPNRKTLTVPISHPEDDATETEEGRVDLTGHQLFLGGFQETTTGLRFTEINVPPSSVIYDARLDFHSSLGSFSPTLLDLRIEQSLSPAAFEEAPFRLTSRTFTAETVTWVPSTWGYNQRGSRQRSPNFAPLLQQHVGQPGWQAGSPLVFAITGIGSRNAWAFDHDPNFAPVLHIDFDVRDPLEIAVDQPFLVEPIDFSLPGGSLTDGVRIQSRRLARVPPGQGLTYQIETSTTLAEGSWGPIPESEIVNYSEVTAFPWIGLTVDLPLQLLPEAADHFFRLRITKKAAAQ